MDRFPKYLVKAELNIVKEGKQMQISRMFLDKSPSKARKDALSFFDSLIDTVKDYTVEISNSEKERSEFFKKIFKTVNYSRCIIKDEMFTAIEREFGVMIYAIFDNKRYFTKENEVVYENKAIIKCFDNAPDNRNTVEAVRLGIVKELTFYGENNLLFE